MSAASILRVSEIPALLTGTKWLCHSSDQGASMPRQEEEDTLELDITPKEPPHWNWKEGMPAARPLRENHQRPSPGLVKVARWAYHKIHQPNYEHEGSYNLSPSSGSWPLPPTSWALRSMRLRRHGLAGKTSRPLTLWPNLPLRTSASLGSCHPLNHPRSLA